MCFFFVCRRIIDLLQSLVARLRTLRNFVRSNREYQAVKRALDAFRARAMHLAHVRDNDEESSTEADNDSAVESIEHGILL